MASLKRIEVAVGIVVNSDCEVLVGQRVVKDRYFGKWEFPGGKIEPGEAVEAALQREFLEETGLVLGKGQPFMQIDHDYPDRQVRLHVYLVDDFSGELEAREGQALKWVTPAELNHLDFLEGNQLMLDKLEQRLAQVR